MGTEEKSKTIQDIDKTFGDAIIYIMSYKKKILVIDDSKNVMEEIMSKIKKGGQNTKPLTPRPDPPKSRTKESKDICLELKMVFNHSCLNCNYRNSSCMITCSVLAIKAENYLRTFNYIKK